MLPGRLVKAVTAFAYAEQDQLANLNLQNKELEAKLQAAKVGGGAPTSGPKGAHGVPHPGPASKSEDRRLFPRSSCAVNALTMSGVVFNECRRAPGQHECGRQG